MKTKRKISRGKKSRKQQGGIITWKSKLDKCEHESTKCKHELTKCDNGVENLMDETERLITELNKYNKNDQDVMLENLHKEIEVLSNDTVQLLKKNKDLEVNNKELHDELYGLNNETVEPLRKKNKELHDELYGLSKKNENNEKQLIEDKIRINSLLQQLQNYMLNYNKKEEETILDKITNVVAKNKKNHFTKHSEPVRDLVLKSTTDSTTDIDQLEKDLIKDLKLLEDFLLEN
jgi:hypothetical protein